MNRNEGGVGTVVDWGLGIGDWGLGRGGEGDSESVSGDTITSLSVSFLNIGLVEGSVRAVRSEEFSVSSELSDHLCRWERKEKS